MCLHLKRASIIRPCCAPVLHLAGTELIFFLASEMFLCFGFRVRIMLIALRCSSCCRAVLTPSQGLFSFSHCPASAEAGGAPGAGRGHSWDSWPRPAKGMSRTLCIMLSNKTAGSWPGGAAAAQGAAAYWSSGG